MGLFTEQFGPPDKVTYELPETLPGSLKELSREGGGAILREIQAQVYVSVDIAKSLINWLTDKVTQAEQIQKEIETRKQLQGTDTAVETQIVEAKE